MPKQNNSFFKRFGKTEYSKDKEYLNAIVVSDTEFVAPKKAQRKSIKALIYVYAAIVFFVTALSIGMLGVSDEYQKTHKAIFSIIEIIVFIVLVVDVSLRWYTSEVRLKKGNWSYFIFPFTIVGAMMIASLLPSLYLINVWTGDSVKVFETLGNMKFLRVFRLILLANLIPALGIFRRVLSKEKSTLYVVFSIVIITILVFALVMYNVEGADSISARKEAIELYNNSAHTSVTYDSVFTSSGADKALAGDVLQFVKIHSFLDALYFSTVALTTIGFGDISPITNVGKVITMVMSIIGIAVLATPSGVIAGGFIQEIKESKKAKAKLEKQ